MYENLEYANSAELCERMAAECDTVILAFSTGKDSIAAWLQLRKFFKTVIPFYKYVIPGLSFVEDSLKYYEDFFGVKIHQFPHPAYYRIMQQFTHQPPYRYEEIAGWGVDTKWDYTEEYLADIIRYRLKLPEEVYTATGVRMADSPYRRVALLRYGAVNHNRKSFMPVYDWVKADMLREIDAAGIQLPVDYRLFGRTFDGLDYRFLKPIQENYPEDFQKILRHFPFADLEIARWDGLDAIARRTVDDIE